MSLLKHATFDVISARYASKGEPLARTAHRVDFSYEPRVGYLYVRSRAISSRCNDNFDEFPAEEIKTAYRTFIGKPVFVNHHNANHRRARGVIIDAALHEDRNPDGSMDTWVEVLMEVDAIRFPKLAEAIVKGHIERTSMGTDVAYSVCSICNNKASSPVDYCQHIPKLKGQRIYRTTASGHKEGVLVREICYGLGFFENSLLVEDPADPTAFFTGVDKRGVEGIMATASRRHAISFEGDEESSIPAGIDTLRREQCPVCSESDSYDGEECRVCGFITPPAEFGDPDLTKAKDVSKEREEDAEQLKCDHCDASFSGNSRTSLVLTRDDDTDEDGAGIQKGESCPECQGGTLKTASDDDDDDFEDAASDDDDDDDFEGASDDDEDDDDEDDEEFLPAASDDDDDEDGDDESSQQKPTAARHGSNRRMRVDMRPALAALAAQQKQIDALNAAVSTIAKAAGIESNPRIARLLRVASGENPAQPDGWATSPSSTETASESTEQAATPTATDNPEGIGASPLTDTSADATADVTAVGGVVDEPLDLNKEDVTAPVAGTEDLGEGPVGQAGTGRTETDVRADTGDDTPAFSDGGFLSSKSEARTIASLRLSRLRIEAGIAKGDDLDLSQTIASSDMSAQQIASEIQVLTKVVANNKTQPARTRASRGLVPQMAQTARLTPSLGSVSVPTQSIVSGVRSEEMAFE